MENNIKIIKKCKEQKSHVEIFLDILKILDDNGEGWEDYSNICKTEQGRG